MIAGKDNGNGKPKKKAGRPKKQINGEQVRKLAALMCTNAEIADFFDCSHDTIERNYAAELKKGRADAKVSLRRKQFAMSGKSAAMGIWLGKQILNQKDRVEVDHTAIIHEKLKIEGMPEPGGNGNGKDKFSRFYN